MPAVHGNPKAVPSGMVDVTAKPATQAPAKPVVTAKPMGDSAPVPATESAASEPTTMAEVAAESVPPVEASKSEQAKAAADKARKGAAHHRKLMEEKARLEQASSYQQQQTAALQQQLDQANHYLRTLQQDPLGAMKQLGITPEQVAQRMMKEGSPEGKIEYLEQQLQAQRDEIRRMQDSARQEQEAIRRQQIETEYKQEAQNAKKYPSLANVHPDFILSRTKELILDLRHRGYDPRQFSNHDLLSYLDSTYTKSGSTPVSETTPETKSDKKTSTITNRMQTATHAAPPDFAKMNDRQQKKWMADQLRAQFSK